MDDQEILNLMKTSGKKKRSRNCLISSNTLGKENFKINQIVGSENATVYALVEVSNDTEKLAKREKIPLNNKDFFRIMQKFMTSQSVKPGRKILKPLKRKHVVESTSVSTHISKEEKNIQNDALTHHELADEIGVIYKRSNHGIVDKIRDKQGDRNCQRLNSGDHNINENESHYLKILFNRKNPKNQEPIKQERICQISRCTNTDTVQTPKVLEQALQSLNMNFDIERCDGSQCDKKILHFNEFDPGRNAYKAIPSATQNLLFVPFIITSNQISSCEKSCSQQFTKAKYVTLETNELKMNGSKLSDDDLTQKCFADQTIHQSELNSTVVDNQSWTKVDQVVNNETKVAEKEEIQNEPKHHTVLGVSGEEYLLKEVKTLQEKINAIVESLEKRNFPFLNNSGNDNVNDDALINGLISAEETNDHSSTQKSATKKPTENVLQYLDCGVQAVIMKTYSHKIVAVPSETVVKTFVHRFVQSPSEGKIKSQPKPSKLITCKSSPHFSGNFDSQFVSMKRATSLMTFNRRIEEAKYFSARNFDINCERYSPENHDQIDEVSKTELVKNTSKGEPHRSHKSTNILLKKKNMTFSTGNDKLVTIKKCGNIAKIRIVGSTTLFTENQDSDAGKIKLELNELGSIKISNKFSRKTKTIDNNSNCKSRSNNLCDNSKVADSNVSRNVKDQESNKKVIGKETVRKMARRELVQKNVEDPKSTGSNSDTFAKDADSQSISRVPKLKKPSTPYQVFSGGQEDGLDSVKSPGIETPEDQTVAEKTNENQWTRYPSNAKSAEKVNEKKNIARLITKKQLPSLVASSRNGKSPCGTVREPETEQSREEVLRKSVVQTTNEDKQSSPIKSIWALTKVVLYEDGSQSVEVLEASSHPLKYQLNKTLGNNDGSESNITIPTVNNQCINNSSEEKSH